MPGETPLDIQIRNTTRNVAYLLTHIISIKQELKEMHEEQKKFVELAAKLLYDPQSRTNEEQPKKPYNL